jgi:hypothetical protein
MQNDCEALVEENGAFFCFIDGRVCPHVDKAACEKYHVYVFPKVFKYERFSLEDGNKTPYRIRE